jgi:hypothetical protein
MSLSLLLFTMFCICKLKQLYLGNRSEYDTCYYHLFLSQLQRNRFPEY